MFQLYHLSRIRLVEQIQKKVYRKVHLDRSQIVNQIYSDNRAQYIGSYRLLRAI